MLHTLQKPRGKGLCVGLNLRQNISKIKFKPTLNYTENIKTCSKLYKKERRKYYESLDMKNVSDSKKFWKTMGPFLSDKNTVFSQISIEKNSRIISDDFVLPEEFTTFFEDAVRLLNVEPDEYYLSDTENLSNPVEIAIRKFENLFKLLSKIFL